MEKKAVIRATGRGLAALAGLLMLVGGALHPSEAWAVDCSQVLTAGETGADSDTDGFTDYQECTRIDTIGTSPRTFHSCRTADGAAQAPECLDPDARDLFVIFAPATGSLLPVDDTGQTFNAFAQQTFYGITFRGLSALGLRVHQLKPEEAHVDRFVTSAVLSLPQMKAVKVTESLNVSGTVLGYCQWGSPLGLDGCTIFTQRTKNFIESTCGSAEIQTPGRVASDAVNVLRAYSTYLILHETGHSLGGLTGQYDSRFGGYHYKAGSALVMEQAVTYTVKGGKCTFYISPDWNQTLDPPAVKLIN